MDFLSHFRTIHFSKAVKAPKKRVVLFFIALFTLFLIETPYHLEATPARNEKSQIDPIRLGAVFSTSGIAAPHNKPLVQMAKLAVDHINKNGGLLNRPVELVLLDNSSTPIGSALAAQKIISQKIPAVIGAHWSSHSLAMADILQNSGVLMISPGSTNPAITTGKDYVFRACFVDSFQGLAMAKFAIEELQAKTAVVIANIDEDYSTTLARYFSTAFTKRGGKVTAEINYRGDATDFTENIEIIQGLKPDVVYLPGYTRDSGLFIKQARKHGITAIFLGGDAWDEIETYSGTSVDGSFQSAPWHPQVPFEKSKELQDLFHASYGEKIKNTSSPLAFDAVMILAEAIRQADSIEPARIREKLASISYSGATGQITFDANGDPIAKAAIIIEFSNNNRIFRKAVTP